MVQPPRHAAQEEKGHPSGDHLININDLPKGGMSYDELFSRH
jgi:hypothetical protein